MFGNKYLKSPLLGDLSLVLRRIAAISLLLPGLAVGGNETESTGTKDFYITLTANDLCLCGEGFGGIYGCIDEAISRGVSSVVIAASSKATVEVVQELINAAHSAGFDAVGFVTLEESET